MKLYYSKGACSLAVRIIIHEMGLKCEFESVNLKEKKTEKGDDFFKVNPKGSVPALITEDHKTLTENLAIQQYLAEKNNAVELLPPVGRFDRYRVLEWFSFVSTELHKNFGALFNPNVEDKMKKELFIPLLKKKFSYVETQLAGKKFLMGDVFTLPDAYLFVVLRWAAPMGVDLQDCPHLNRYFNDLKNRRSVHQSLEEEHLH